jgi:hypothetical protein
LCTGAARRNERDSLHEGRRLEGLVDRDTSRKDRLMKARLARVAALLAAVAATALAGGASLKGF